MRGPQFRLYILGRGMEEIVPIAFLPENHALAIAIMTEGDLWATTTPFPSLRLGGQAPRAVARGGKQGGAQAERGGGSSKRVEELRGQTSAQDGGQARELTGFAIFHRGFDGAGSS